MGPICLRNALGVHDENSSPGGEGLPGAVLRAGVLGEWPPGQAQIRIEQSLALEADGRKDFVVPENVTARAELFALELHIERHRFVSLGVVVRGDVETGALGEFRKHGFSEFLVLGTIEDDARLGGAAAGEKKCEKS